MKMEKSIGLLSFYNTLLFRLFDGTISWLLFGFHNSAWHSRILLLLELLLNGFLQGSWYFK